MYLSTYWLPCFHSFFSILGILFRLCVKIAPKNENILKMSTEEYLKQRVDDQTKWYSKKSTVFKKRHQTLRVVVILISVILPFLTGVMSDETPYIKIAIGVGSLLIAFFEGISSLFKYQEQWLNYRNTAETLKREKLLFLTKSGPYETSQALSLLVTRCEGIMSEENQTWQSTQTE